MDIIDLPSRALKSHTCSRSTAGRALRTHTWKGIHRENIRQFCSC